MTEPLVRALPAASLENQANESHDQANTSTDCQANVLDELAWAARTLYRYGITSDERDAELRAYTGAPFRVRPTMAPWLAVITAAQAVIATDDEWILDIPDEDWDPKMLALRDAVKALEEPVSACGHCGEPSCGHRSSDLFAEEPSHA